MIDLRSQYQMFNEYSHHDGALSHRRHGNSRMLYFFLVILIVGLLLTLLNIFELHRMRIDHEKHNDVIARGPVTDAPVVGKSSFKPSLPIVWLQGSPNAKNNGPSGYLKHVYIIFERLGFGIGGKFSDWLVMWSHDYPFVSYSSIMKSLNPYQRVNHFPGSGFITNKVSLAQTELDFIPKAFQLPAKKDEFLSFAKANKNTSWVQKSNKHRGIRIKSSDKVDFSLNGTFVQEYISKPFLVDGHKFDIGVYSIVTSIDPLRVYFIGGETLFRFCPVQYHPFDPFNLDKYVIGDEYKPMWEMPSLSQSLASKKFSFKNTFDNYLVSLGKDPRTLWQNVYRAIREVFLVKEKDLINSSKSYMSKRNFFEMMRFDFVLDENLRAFLMEANMSPNLSSDHFKENARMYEHVLYNLLNLVGVAHLSSYSKKKHPDYLDPSVVSSQDIHVFPEYCSSTQCTDNCSMLKCKLCQGCLSEEMEIDLKLAFLEHNRRGTARRIFPPPINETLAKTFSPDANFLDTYTPHNKIMYMWFVGKCKQDAGWCY